MKHTGLFSNRTTINPLEASFAKKWQNWNDSSDILRYLIGGEQVENSTEREKEVAATVIQWLGSPVGQDFLKEAMDPLV